MTSVRLALAVGEDPLQLIAAHGGKYVADYCFDLNLQAKIGLAELMILLVNLYQKLENYNNHIRYEVLPRPMEMVECQRFASVALGGTFDYLHSGHLLLLTYARMLLREDGELIVGVTAESMLANKKNKEFLQSLCTRQKRVREFLERLATKKPRVFQLKDPYGPTITQKDVQAMVITRQTEAAGPKINEMRAAQSFPPLTVFVMELVGDSTQTLSKVSSTLIRKRLQQKNRFTGEQRVEYRRLWQEACRKLFSVAGWKHPLSSSLQYLVTMEGEYIFQRYSEAWRHYHTNFHIFTLLEQYRNDAAYRQKQLNEEEQVALLLSIFYHDLVYQPDRNDNEQQSAYLLESFISKAENLSSLKLSEVGRRASELILMTKHHKPKDHLESMLNDLDMSVLAAPLPSYQLYSHQIKQEYIALFPSELEFNKKRSAFLSDLQPSTVFHLHPDRQQPCRHNVEWQLKFLADAPPLEH